MFQILLSGELLGSLIFSIFINDLICFIKDAQLLNLIDDNTIATFSNSVGDLITELQKKIWKGYIMV